MMKRIPALFLLFASTLYFFACKKSENKAEAPFLSLVAMSKDSIASGRNQDTVALQIYIKDKNGDLISNAAAFYLKSSHDTAFVPYDFPEIDESILNNPNGLEGEILFFVTGDIANARLDSLHQAVGDTIQYEIYVKDQAGNESNHINAGPIYIKL